MNLYLKDFINKKFKKEGKALDLGAGNFNDVLYLNNAGWDCEGVDIKNGVDLEKKYLSKNGPFDLVFSNYLIHKLKNKENIIQTIFDNLKKDGWFFIHTFDKSDENSSSKLDENILKNLLENVGFKEVDTKVFDYYDDEEGHKHWHKILEAVGKK